MSWENNTGDFGASDPQSLNNSFNPEEEQKRRAYRDFKWASNRSRYEYNENTVDENGMAPRDEALEQELFGSERQDGIDFSKYAKIPVKVERGAAPPPIRSVSTIFLLL